MRIGFFPLLCLRLAAIKGSEAKPLLEKPPSNGPSTSSFRSDSQGPSRRSTSINDPLLPRRKAQEDAGSETSLMEIGANPDSPCLPEELPLPPPYSVPFTNKLKALVGSDVRDTHMRIIPRGEGATMYDFSAYPSNEINNCRYNLVTFFPKALLEQFKLFFNIYFLAVAVSQFIPVLKVGFIFIYFAPLAFVVGLSLAREAVDDLLRWRRDRIVNGEVYEVVQIDGSINQVKAKDIKVGDLLQIHTKQRIPADCILLRTTESSGASFVRTDQLDGETDWKLRFPAKLTKDLSVEEIARLRLNVQCEATHNDIYKFHGRLEVGGAEPEGVDLEATLWCSCVVASGTVTAIVIHTGKDTRSAMNAAKASTKRGLIDSELNTIGLSCFLLLMLLSFLLVVQQHFQGKWLVNFTRFQILLSSIIPISMRVNLDLGRIWYSFVIYRDKEIPGTIARNTNIPEELGRLCYLFSDKTGTLTKNVMEFRTLVYGQSSSLQHTDTDDFDQALGLYFSSGKSGSATKEKGRRRDVCGFSAQNVKDIGTAVMALALCHNVTPVTTETGEVEFQASSPDEVAMVKFASSIGVVLEDRTLERIRISTRGQTLDYQIVKMFPFSSERKCMGIILKEESTGTLTYFMKGADVKMKKVVRSCEWIDESCDDMAQKGLRTLVFAQRQLTEELVKTFLDKHRAAGAILNEVERKGAAEAAMDFLEAQMTIVAITGVEDQLQDDVTAALETIRLCGIRVWMLTGDKVETATCIGRSTQLISKSAMIEQLTEKTVEGCQRVLDELEEKYNPNFSGGVSASWALILDGDTLARCLEAEVKPKFIQVAKWAQSVIVARCAPTQKAEVVKAIKDSCTNATRTAAIGDGGNDVSMILAAHVGIGIEGVEGKQASMAADFSITQFSYCLRLIMWHGRNSYKRSCQLSQFIMHRGIVYAIVQTIFSMMFGGSTMSVFNGYLLMGYATIFTMAPVFALVLNEDYDEKAIERFPELYKSLLKARSMNMRSFLQWVWVSFFQGGVMMLVTIALLADELFQLVSIAFTALLLTELVIVAGVVHFKILWRQRRRNFFLFVSAEAISILFFFAAVFLLPDTFDTKFFFSIPFLWKTLAICAASIGPIFLMWILARCFIFRKETRLNFQSVYEPLP